MNIKLIINSFKNLLLVFYFTAILLSRWLKNKPLVIISDQYGRLGNRLYLFSQFILFCKKTNYELWIPGFYEYKTYFSKKNNLLSFQSSIEKNLYFISEEDFYFSIVRILSIIKRFKSSNKFILNFQYDEEGNPWDRIIKTRFPVIFFEGFIFHKYKIDTENNLELIKDIFKPATRFHSEINKPIHSLRQTNDLICGILIRQTDYKTWEGGKYFFETTDYINFINFIISVLHNCKVGFFIAVDEKQNEILFSDIDCILRIGEPVENIYTLSQCDFLVGPPSSFIGWAAYYGQKDLFTIESINYFKSNIKKFLKQI